jgi:putative acetyltransferase
VEVRASEDADLHPFEDSGRALTWDVTALTKKIASAAPSRPLPQAGEGLQDAAFALLTSLGVIAKRRVIIRDETISDRAAIHGVQALAFGGTAEAKLVENLRLSGDAVISLVAVEGDRILGHILLSRLGAPMRALALAPVAVHPDFQRRGIGSALVREGLERARRDGWEAVFVLGDPGYYGRFGFSVEAARGYISPYSGEHFMMLPLCARRIPTTGQLVYPAPFALLD